MMGGWRLGSGIEWLLLGRYVFIEKFFSVFSHFIGWQIKGADSPITRIFGGKFRSTLRAPQQKDSVIVEDWRALRLDIQVRFCSCVVIRFFSLYYHHLSICFPIFAIPNSTPHLTSTTPFTLFKTLLHTSLLLNRSNCPTRRGQGANKCLLRPCQRCWSCISSGFVS